MEAFQSSDGFLFPEICRRYPVQKIRQREYIQFADLYLCASRTECRDDGVLSRDNAEKQHHSYACRHILHSGQYVHIQTYLNQTCQSLKDTDEGCGQALKLHYSRHRNDRDDKGKRSGGRIFSEMGRIPGECQYSKGKIRQAQSVPWQCPRYSIRIHQYTGTYDRCISDNTGKIHHRYDNLLSGLPCVIYFTCIDLYIHRPDTTGAKDTDGTDRGCDEVSLR